MVFITHLYIAIELMQNLRRGLTKIAGGPFDIRLFPYKKSTQLQPQTTYVTYFVVIVVEADSQTEAERRGKQNPQKPLENCLVR